MQRYFVEDINISNDTVKINNSDFHHIKNVMRFKIGDIVIINTYSGKSYKSQILEYTKKEVILKKIEELEPRNNTLNLSIAQALIKKDNFEMILQKTTELGIKAIYPIHTENSIIKIDDYSKKKSRYEAIVKEASEQSERDLMPTIMDYTDLRELPFAKYDHVIVAYARENNTNLKEVLNSIGRNESILFIIGPEGGFSKSEIVFLEAKAKLVSLGKTILRSETAAIYLTSVLKYLTEVILWE